MGYRFIFICSVVLLMSSCDGTETPHDGEDPGEQPTDTTPFDIADMGAAIDLGCKDKCSAVPQGKGFGTTAMQMACAMELCGDDVVLDAHVESLHKLRGEEPILPEVIGTDHEECVLRNMARAIRRFGGVYNDLKPAEGDSYALLATGPVTTENWSNCDLHHCYNDCQEYIEHTPDPLVNENLVGWSVISDPIELKLTLRAPPDAFGFSVKYVFMSSSFDRGLSKMHQSMLAGQYKHMHFDDKFYIFKNEVGASIANRTLLNYSGCRWPDLYWMRECDVYDLDCERGEKICPVSVLSDLGECCWHDCQKTGDELDLGGTGFQCADDLESDDESSSGSSTGWIETRRLVTPGEVFELVFHIHDAGVMGFGSSAVIIDSFQFLREDPTHEIPL